MAIVYFYNTRSCYLHSIIVDIERTDSTLLLYWPTKRSRQATAGWKSS